MNNLVCIRILDSYINHPRYQDLRDAYNKKYKDSFRQVLWEIERAKIAETK